MMNFRTFSVLSVFTFLVQGAILNAVICRVKIFRHVTTQQILIVCEDIHRGLAGDRERSDQEQIDLVTGLSCLNGAAIVEDLHSLTGHMARLYQNVLSKATFEWLELVFDHAQQNFRGLPLAGGLIKLIPESDSVAPEMNDTMSWSVAGECSALQGLSHYCAMSGIPVYNGEMRHYNFGIGEGLVTWENIVWLHQGLFREIGSWDDGLLFSNFYAQCIDKVSNGMSRRDIVRLYPLKNWMVVDSPLIDAYLAHGVNSYKDKPVVCVCAGALHCQNLYPVFVEIGYQEIKTFGNGYWQHPKQNSWIVSTVDLKNVFAYIKNVKV